jgi:hypothetical protein
MALLKIIKVIPREHEVRWVLQPFEWPQEDAVSSTSVNSPLIKRKAVSTAIVQFFKYD